jgi:DNA-directed RNA polymerase specialized sigma24 family protein
MADRPAGEVDHDAALDLRGAVAALPPRQRAVLVLRFYCDLNVDQSAQVLNCSPGTVKSQTAKAISALRRALAAGHGARPDVAQGRSGYREVSDHG